ncbi:hypothetical protein PC123_g5757 [Phytophthora cactorum]|nr:hypothetical protein PC120_g3811 [Phytophthora cactorum]KAG4059305.1 hypothetical protein PC123_g5757 [Phytophthora cactorum]
MDMIIGDILFPKHAIAEAPRRFVTPGHSRRCLQGFRPGTNLWLAGEVMVNTAGSQPVASSHEVAVLELLSVDDDSLPNPLVSYGRPCLEWLPLAENGTTFNAEDCYCERRDAVRDMDYDHYSKLYWLIFRISYSRIPRGASSWLLKIRPLNTRPGQEACCSSPPGLL